MATIRITALAAIILLAPTNLLAEWKGLFVSWLEDKCIDGHIHTLTYYSVLGGAFPFTILDVDTGKPCCQSKSMVGSAAASSAVRFRPEDSPFCLVDSTGTNAKTTAPVSNLIIWVEQGSQPYSRLPGSHVNRAVPPLATATGSTAYVPSEPFRQFALPPYPSGSTTPPTVSPQCNSKLNPTAFRVIHATSTVIRYNMCSGVTLAAIDVTANPLEVAVTPDGAWAIVTSYNQAITFINTDNNTVANVIHTDQDTFPFGIAISPDGSYALVTSYIDDHPALLVVDVPKQIIKSRMPLGGQYPQSVFLSPEATLAWVTYPFSNLVEVIDIATGNVNASLLAQYPVDVAFNLTGTVAYISGASSGSVRAVDTTTYSVIKEIPTGAGASDLLLSPAGDYLTVNNYGASSVSVIDTTALKVVSTTHVSGQPIGTMLVPIQ